MLNIIIDAIGAVSAVMLVWCMVRAYTSKGQKSDQADTIPIEDYLQKITLVTGFSVYDTFHKSAEEWHVPADRIDRDFNEYLSSQTVPYYVKDFVRKSQKHIDELYRGKGSSRKDKRLLISYSILMLLFWGGAIFLCLYVFPHVWPEEFRANIHIGPP
jgi:hypothetical protein